MPTTASTHGSKRPTRGTARRRGSAASSSGEKRRAGGEKPAAARGSTRAPATPATADAEAIALAEQLHPGFRLTHLEKLLYPEPGFSKAHLVTYYVAVAPLMLPHVAGRPLTLLRCPDGSRAGCFVQKHVAGALPEAIKRVSIAEARGRGTYGIVEDVEGLVALAQLGVLEVHVWNSRAPELERPDQLVFDLDPDQGLAWDRVVEAALAVRERLHALGLTSFVKGSGGKGLHVVAPLARALDWEQHLALARGLSLELVREQPQRYVVDVRKGARKGKVLLDYLRNARGATAIAPYSTRAHANAPIATPMHWDELKAGVRPQTFDLRAVVRRLERPTRDPWEGFAALAQTVPAARLRPLLALGARK